MLGFVPGCVRRSASKGLSMSPKLSGRAGSSPVIPPVGTSRVRNPRKWRRGSAAKGCLIAVAIVLVLAIAGGIIVAMNFKSWATSAVKAVTVSMIQKSEIPQDQKDRIVKRVDTLATDFKSGKLTGDQLERVLKAVGESPVFPLAMVEGAMLKYVEPSALSKEEKQAARLTLQRFARGVYEEKIHKDAVKEVLAPIQTVDAAGKPQPKQVVTPEELKQFLDLAKSKADAAKIPEEPFVINYADELDKAIDGALAAPALPAPTPTNTPPAPAPK